MPTKDKSKYIGTPPALPDVDKILWEIPVEKLSLSLRIYLLLKRNKINSVGEIVAQWEQLDSFAGMGLERINQIHAALLAIPHLGNEPASISSRDQPSNSANSDPEQAVRGINDYLPWAFATLSPRERSIIPVMNQFDNGDKLNRAEAARRFGVSRERIVQIEDAGMGKIKARLAKLIAFPLFEKQKELIQCAGGVISELRLVEQLKSSFVDADFDFQVFLIFVRRLFGAAGLPPAYPYGRKMIYVPELKAWILSPLSPEQVLLMAERITAILQPSTNAISLAELFSIIKARMDLQGTDENLVQAVVVCLVDLGQIFWDAEAGWYIKMAIGQKNRIIAVMKNIGRPAHFREIAQSHNELYTTEPLLAQQVYLILVADEQFIRTAKGTYGLAIWDISHDENLADTVQRILLSNNQPMTLKEIGVELLKIRHAKIQSIHCAIESDARFYKTETGEIWLTEFGKTPRRIARNTDRFRWKRIALILQELGHPASIKQIVEIHNNTHPDHPMTAHSVSDLVNIRTDVFFRTKAGEAGLVERSIDAGINRGKIVGEEILKIIQVHSPIHFMVLLKMYNQKYPDRPIGVMRMRAQLCKLGKQIEKDSKRKYQLKAVQEQ